MASLKTKIKQAFDSVLPEREALLYFKDEFRLREWDRDASPAVDAGNWLLNRYKAVTGYKITSVSELRELVNNPAEFYKAQHTTANYKDFEQLLKLKVAFTIDLPEQWASVLDSVKQFAKHLRYAEQDFITVQDGSIELTERYYMKRNSKCCHYAITDEEKERVAFCNKIIADIEQLEGVLKENPKFATAISKKLYFYPLPYFLISVKTPGGIKIIPNPKFVKEFFGGTAHLGYYIPSSADIDRAKADERHRNNLGEPYVMFTKNMGDGVFRDFLCRERDYESKHKNINTRLLPGKFNEQGRPWGTAIELRESWKTPPHGRFEN